MRPISSLSPQSIRARNSWLLTLSSLCLTLLLTPQVAIAQTTNTAGKATPFASSRLQAGGLLEYTVCRSAATFPLDVSTLTPTMVELPRGFEKFLDDDGIDWVKRDGNKIYVVPPKSTPKNTEIGLRIRAQDPVRFEASLQIRVVHHVRGVDDSVVIYHQSDEERFGKRPEENPCISQELSPMQRLRIRAFARQQGNSGNVGIPEIAQVARSGEGVPIELSMYEIDSGNLVVDFAANNRYATTSKLTEIRVRDRNGKEMESEIWRWNELGEPVHGQGLVVNGFQQLQASIHIPNADDHELEPMWVEFRGTRGSAPFVVAMQVGTFRHMTPEEIEQMRRDEERRRELEELRRRNEQRREREWERTRRSRQLAITIRGLVGGFWLSDGAEQGMMSATTTKGVGVRVTKGILPNFAFEGEAIGGWTGTASFQEVSWNNMQGEVARSASFARLQAAGVVRFGEKYVVSTRFAFGVQGTQYDSAFDRNGESMPGPGDDSEAALFLAFGGSVDTRLGDHWTVGAGAAFSQAFEGPRALEAGIHAGYRWAP